MRSVHCACAILVFSTANAQVYDKTTTQSGSASQLHSPIALNLPPAIAKSETNRYAEIIDLSPSQAAYLNHLLERYLQQRTELERQHLPAILEWARQVADGPFDPDYLDRYQTFHSKLADARNDMLLIEQALFDELELIVADVQRPGLARARMHRDRARANVDERAIYSSRIDLSRLIEQMGWPPELKDRLEPLRTKYENEVTPPFVALDESIAKREPTLMRLFVRGNFGDDRQRLDFEKPASRDRRRESMAMRESILSERARLQRQIARLNHDYLKGFIALLPEAEAAALQERYRLMAFPRIYPDQTDPHSLFQRASADETVEDALREALKETWIKYRTEYERINADMCDEFETWRERLAATQESSGSGSYAERMIALREQRWSKNEEVVRILRSMLPPAVAQTFAPQFEELTGRIASARARGKTDRFPPT